jgi:hypothetical protein
MIGPVGFVFGGGVLGAYEVGLARAVLEVPFEGCAASLERAAEWRARIDDWIGHRTP